MRFVFLSLMALFVGALTAHFFLQDPGYVGINFWGYAAEMSVPVFILVLGVAYLAVRVLVILWRAPRRFGQAVADRRLRQAGKKLTRGLIHLAEGEWSKGEQLLTQGLKNTDAPLINYLMAARAAQLQGSSERRDDWLKLAYEELPEAEIAVLLTQAELQLEHNELERALATLSRIQEARPEHPVALALLARIYKALQDWDQLVMLLPKLGQARLMPEMTDSLAAEGFQATLVQRGISKEELDALWSGLPAKTRKSTKLVRLRSQALNMLGRGNEAEKEIRAALKRHWDKELVLGYGQIETEEPLRQLKRAEEWLKAHPEDASLLVTTARLCMVNELWGKAKSYLESSIAIAPGSNAYALYGRLLNKLGQEEEAKAAFCSGLALVTDSVTDPPGLDQSEGKK